ncbi:MAG: DUF3553 domain-containing protein [Flavobacteriales bacterium]
MEQIVRAGMLVKHPTYGKGTVISVNNNILTINFPNRGNLDISKRTEGLEIYEPEPEGEENEEFSMSQMERTLRKILSEYADIQQTVPMGEKWSGGTLILQPGDTSLKGKEVPIETFFHKIVMVRDRLRVLEQNINSHQKLSDEDKINLQQYITRIYGSLTTFNVLFKDNAHYFVGEKKS